LSWIHREFYERIPEEWRIVRSPGGRESLVVPGAWRDEDVSVGRHAPPSPGELPGLLRRFHEAYAVRRLEGLDRVAAIPAAHHRLLWIHPFLDGNGRVARLYIDACLRGAALGAHGLWTASRGLARNRARYLALLEAADAERWDDYDGRGARSARSLNEWCGFFLDVCLDQVRYMRELLNPDELIARIRAWNATHASRGELPDDAWRLLAEIVRRGQLPRGEGRRALGTSDRTARRAIAALTKIGAVTSRTPKGPLLLSIPAPALEAWFPALAPA
jgi:Fic family protein